MCHWSFSARVSHANVAGQGHLNVALGTQAVGCQMTRPRRRIEAASPHASIHGIQAQRRRRHRAVEPAVRHGSQRVIEVEGAAILICGDTTPGALDEGLGTFELAMVVQGAGTMGGLQPTLLRCPMHRQPYQHLIPLFSPTMTQPLKPRDDSLPTPVTLPPGKTSQEKNKQRDTWASGASW